MPEAAAEAAPLGPAICMVNTCYGLGAAESRVGIAEVSSLVLQVYVTDPNKTT